MALTNFTPYDDDDDTTKDSSVSSQGREQEGGTRQDSWEIIDESDAVSQEDRQLILVEEVLGSENGADGCDTTSTEAIPAVPSRSDEALNGAGAVDTTDEAATETQAVDSNHEGQEQDESFPAVTTVENLDLSNESNLHDDVQISVDETSGEEKYDASSEVPANEASVETVKIKNPEGPSQRDEFMHTEAVKAEDTNAVLDKDSANESPYDCPALKSDESLDELEMPSTTDETSDDPNLSMLLSMGFDFQQSKLALAANGGNLEKAVECLLAGDYNNHSNDGPDKAFEYERKIDEAMMYDSSDPWFEISGNQGMDGDTVPIPNANTQQSQQQREQQHNGTWNFLESTLQDLDNRHQLRQRTKRSITNLHQSARHLWTDITNQTQSLRSNLQSTCDDADALARHRARSISHAASSAKDSMCRANSEYKIAEKVAAVAVVGGATLIALGNPRMGAGALAAAGATLAVGEVLKAEEERGSCCTFTRDIGLREGVHID